MDIQALNARIHERRLREHFHQIVLAEHVTSVYEPIVNARTRRIMGYDRPEFLRGLQTTHDFSRARRDSGAHLLLWRVDGRRPVDPR